MRQRTQLVLGILAAAVLWGCSPEVVPSTGPRPATTPAQVEFYQKEPSRYEKLGVVTFEIKSIDDWKRNADATPAFEALRAKAAALGANGILLEDETKQAVITAGARYEKTYYLVPVRHDPNLVVGEAIYVLSK